MTTMGWWELLSCCSYSILTWMEEWVGLCPSKSSCKAWNLLFSAVVWTIWEFRNNVVFSGKSASIQMALDNVKFRVAWWFKNCGRGCSEDITVLFLDIERCVDKIPVKASRLDVWKPPLNNDLSFNVDGSSCGNPGSARIGGVLRDARG